MSSSLNARQEKVTLEQRELKNFNIKISFIWRDIANLYWSLIKCQALPEVLYIDYVI